MSHKYDVIIVGAGMGGLFTGAYLAKSGVRVLILEKNIQPGGCCVSFSRKGFVFDAGAHLFGSCGERQMLGMFLKGLGVPNDFIQLDPTDILNFPDETIRIPTELDEYIQVLSARFPKEEQALKAFFKEIRKVLYHSKRRHILDKYRDVLFRDLLDGYFSSDRLKSILICQCEYLATGPNEVSTVGMGLMLNSYLKDGAFYPRSGVNVFVNSLVDRFRGYGGEIHTNARVCKIILRDGSACGVVLESGEEHEADIVISNIDPAKMFQEMIDLDVSDIPVMQNMRALEPGRSYFCDYIGIDMPPSELEAIRGWHFASYDIEKEFNRAVYMFVPALFNDLLAPEGASGVEIFRVWPESPSDDQRTGQIRKDLMADNIARLEFLSPGSSSRILFRETATPFTIERYTGNTAGSVIGWKMSPCCMLENRLDHDTGIDNLFLVGHWTNPGGGIASVALSGYILSEKVLQRG